VKASQPSPAPRLEWEHDVGLLPCLKHTTKETNRKSCDVKRPASMGLKDCVRARQARLLCLLETESLDAKTQAFQSELPGRL